MAQKLNWYDRISAYIVEHGYVEIPTRSTKYRRFKMTIPGTKNRQYILGKDGNIRRELLDGSGHVLNSISVTEVFKKFVVAWEEGEK